MKKLTSLQVFQQLQKSAIEWGKQYQIARVGDIVEVQGKGKKPRKYRITRVTVGIGRNAQITIKKALYIDYVGVFQSPSGIKFSGVCLKDFKTKDGKEYRFDDFGINDRLNDWGLSFSIDQDPKISIGINNYLNGDYPYKL